MQRIAAISNGGARTHFFQAPRGLRFPRLVTTFREAISLSARTSFFKMRQFFTPHQLM